MNRLSSLRWVIGVAAITLWTFAVIGTYFVFHKPFGVQTLVALIDSAAAALVTGALLWVAIAIGASVVPSRDEVSPLERCVLSAGAGLGILGLVVFALGLVGGFHRWLFWVLLLVGLIVGSRRTLRVVRPAWTRGLELPPGRFYRFLAFFLGGVLLMAFVQALLPPIAWDSLAYHLTGPKLYVQNHGILLPDVNIPFLGFPELIEMLYTAGLLLGGPVVSQLMHWSFGLLTLAAVYVFALRHFDVRVAWWSMALLYGAPTIVLLSSWAYIDVALMFYSMVSIHSLLRWRESQTIHWLLLSALFCGLAMSTKYTAVGLTTAVLVAIVVVEGQARGWRSAIRVAAFFGAVAALVVAPWLAKNWLLLGNPFYPFVFEGIHWDAFRRLWIGRPGTGLVFTAPWRLFTAPWEMAVVATEGKTGFSATIGPLLLIGLPLLAFVWRGIEDGARRTLAVLFIVSGVQYLIWLYGIAMSAMVVQTRLLFPIFPFLALMSGCALERTTLLRRPAFAIDWLLKALLIIVLGVDLLATGLDTVSIAPLNYLTGLESRESYLSRRLGSYYGAMDYINHNLPENARVFFLWEPRSYYCERQCQPDIILDNFKYLTYRFKTASAIAAHLRDEGYTHVLLFQQGLDFMLNERFDPIDGVDLATLRELERQNLQPVYGEAGPYVLYRLDGR